MSGNGGPRVPGLSVFDNVVRAYQRAWRGQIDAANSFWQDVTGADASFGSVMQSGGKLVDNWYKTVTELFALYGGALDGGVGATRVVTFAIDAQAQSGNDQTLVVPFGVSPSDVKATAVTPLGTAASPPTLTVAAADPGSITLTLEFTDGTNKTPPRPTGTFLSVLYDSNKPQAAAAVGIVIMTFTS
jgi:hypothetical protein